MLDWAGFKERRDAYVSKLNGMYLKNWEKAGIEVVLGLASFVDKNTVRVTTPEGEQTLVGKRVLIACGGEPAAPPIPGIEHAITSDGFFDLSEQPKKVHTHTPNAYKMHINTYTKHKTHAKHTHT